MDTLGPEIRVAPGTDLVSLDRVFMSYQYRPGWGGRLQRPSTPGYHALGHAGAISGVSLADYEQSPTTASQPGAKARLGNLYTPDFQSK